MTSSRPPLRLPPVRALPLAALALVAGCDNGTGPPNGLRFGQIGQVVIELVTPKREGRGELRQSIVWRSSGEWRLSESIVYRGVVGDAHDRASRGDPALSAGAYAEWITRVNEVQGLQIIDFPELSEGTDEDCGIFRTRVTVSITDDVRDETRSWTVCAENDLENLVTRGSGPEGASGRVVQAAMMVRDVTVAAGSPFRSVYAASFPFATLLRGEDLTADVPGGGVIRDPLEWSEFWAGVSDGADPPLSVDFETEVVLVARLHPDTVRVEAGDSVE
ncbi:MAG: hypothetical protein KY453_11055, partial [Gemmatimonadetes bacterium]|nr:hypothetical protein [Gemmatimonadota bacterium]